MPSVDGWKSPASALAYGSISRALPSNHWPRLGIVRTVGLKVIELPGADAGNEDAPDVAPAVGLAVELDDLLRLAVVDLVVQQQPHRRGAAAEDDKLHAILVENGAIRQHVRELELRMDVSHEHGAGLNDEREDGVSTWDRAG